MIKKSLFAALAAITILVAIFVGRMVFQPGPISFAGGHPVKLSEYTGGSPTGVPADAGLADEVARGKYLANAADCAACHTAKDGKPFAGGRAFTLPFGTLYSPNITPDPDTGIGRWTSAQFLKAVHEGVAPDGSRLYPAFPYASYSLLADEDVSSIFAYLQTIPAIRQGNQPNTFVFPFSQRWLMAFWNAFFNPNQRFAPIEQRTPQWNRGAYLVEGLAHCGECHTPRNLMQAMDQRRKFQGGVAEGWNAYDITSDKISGVGGWTDQDLKNYLSNGFAKGHGVASGPMGEAVELSLSKLTENDIAAMVEYLRTVPGATSQHVTSVNEVATSPASAQLQAGMQLFSGSCASCHAFDGTGALNQMAQFNGNRAVSDITGANTVMMVLHGTGVAAGDKAFMPAFGMQFSDDEIAALANYVTRQFGSRASKVSAQDVARLRAQ